MLPHMIGRNHWSWYPRTLRAQLVLLVLTTLVPFVLFPAAVILLYAQQERQTAERGMRETVRAPSVGMALGLSRRIAAPISALVTAAQALGRGEPLARAPASSVQEVHALTSAFVEAGALLQQREAALQEALRSKVESLALLDALFTSAPVGIAFAV